VSHPKTPAEIAQAYFSAWATHDLDTIMRHIGPDCVFVNGTITTTTGAAAIRALFMQYFAAYQAFRFDVLSLATAADGRTVLNERLDFMWKDGKRLDIPCAGTVVVDNGQITAIRDYFDLAAVNAQRGGPPPVS
jgi:limonene-1,2-epoxide hydrolase